MIINDDCLTALDKLEPNSIDSIVTDPPYGLVSITKRFGGGEQGGSIRKRWQFSKIKQRLYG